MYNFQCPEGLLFKGPSMKCRNFILSLMMAVILAACSYDRSDHFTGNAIGPLIGAAAGGGAMAATGTASKPAIGLAGLLGAGVGYYVTTLRFASGGIIQAGGQVYTLGEYTTIEIPSDRLFDVNSSELLPQAESILKSVVTVLNRYPSHNIIISGNTSGFGPARFEHKLSENRAREVATFLWANGITGARGQSMETRRLTYAGYGNYFPIANDITNEGVRTNSRIQITVYPARDQILMDKRQRAFNNVGGLDN
jgi:outer membrane protein OmpA-like peptidoglycan-associated protein